MELTPFFPNGSDLIYVDGKAVALIEVTKMGVWYYDWDEKRRITTKCLPATMKQITECYGPGSASYAKGRKDKPDGRKKKTRKEEPSQLELF